jgi:uncharacterized membrane protein YeiB
MNKYRTALGITLLFFSAVAAYENFLLQQTLERWASLPSTDTLYDIASNMLVLVLVIYIFSFLFGFVGLYLLLRELNTL